MRIVPYYVGACGFGKGGGADAAVDGMIMNMAPKLTDEQRLALDREQGGPIPVEADDGTYVLMSIDAYRAMMGVGTDVDFGASVASLRAGMEEVRSGKTRPLVDALDHLAARHAISR
jgi:hypothetical protein